MIIVKNPCRVVATILARNEADIISANIEHHLNGGVHRIILTDNSSTDSTRALASQYPEVEVIDEPGDDHRQSEWVSRMARDACKMRPDWIVHLDADELWCGLQELRKMDARVVGSVVMHLHPPTGENFSLHGMRHYMDFTAVRGLPGECKVAHRPDPDIVITHGNHGVEGGHPVLYTSNVSRHHYPVRSFAQFRRKAVEGHEALLRRNSICARWENWYNLDRSGELPSLYGSVCDAWRSMRQSPNLDDLLNLLRFWSTDQVIEFFKVTRQLPAIGEWPVR